MREINDVRGHRYVIRLHLVIRVLEHNGVKFDTGNTKKLLLADGCTHEKHHFFDAQHAHNGMVPVRVPVPWSPGDDLTQRHYRNIEFNELPRRELTQKTVFCVGIPVHKLRCLDEETYAELRCNPDVVVTTTRDGQTAQRHIYKEICKVFDPDNEAYQDVEPWPYLSLPNGMFDQMMQSDEEQSDVESESDVEPVVQLQSDEESEEESGDFEQPLPPKRCRYIDDEADSFDEDVAYAENMTDDEDVPSDLD